MWRCEGPHCFAQNRPRTCASALQSLATVEVSKNLLSRDFRHRSIFDFCNNICQEETSVLRAPIGGRLHRTQTVCCFILPLLYRVERRKPPGRGGSQRNRRNNQSSPPPHFGRVTRASLLCWRAPIRLGLPEGCDGDASHALCQKRR